MNSDNLSIYGKSACTGHQESGLRLIAITGGPGSGKTTVLNAARQSLCRHVAMIPEAATILYSGGFWRRSSVAAIRAAQTAIFHVQVQLERIIRDDMLAHSAICDRGTVDGSAYWPDGAAAFWKAMNLDKDAELRRYHAVIHLQTPREALSYSHNNPVRNEGLEEAIRLDEAILRAWQGHPRHTVVPADVDFPRKIVRTVALLHDLLDAKT